MSQLRTRPVSRYRWVGVWITVLLSQLFIHVQMYSDNVPFLDEWMTPVTLAQKVESGTVTLQDVFALHGDHRIVFTNLVTIANVSLLNWYLPAEIILNILLTSCSILLVSSLARWDRSVIATAAALMLSTRIHWLWAFNSQSHFAIFFMLLATWCLKHHSVRGLLGGALAAVAATYSFGYGFFVWPLGLAVLWTERASAKHKGFWLAFGLFQLTLYFLTYNFSRDGYPFDIESYLQFILIYTGSPFAVTAVHAATIGIVGLLFAGLNIVALSQAREVNLLWLTIIGLGLGLGAFIGIGRATMGLWAGLEGRYVIGANLFWIGSLALLFHVFSIRRHRLLKYGNVALLACLMISLVWANMTQWRPFKEERIACVLASEESAQPCLHSLYPYAIDDLPPRIQTLKALNLGPYR